ncbi:unnamed protein product [Lactuca virosa]|uniref:Uncharacterized protein n=1 Tax=Lactuca virosa TaxID=75947 RepID=A0AAU9N8P2_9ASTR|nr:unnamed protein product [Lactuca virosa]
MAMEVKVYCRKNKTEKTRQIDHIPKCFQLPRSASTSKPRTEFFLPICSSKDIELREIQTSVTMGRLNMSNDTIRRTNTIYPFFKSIESENNVKSFGQKAHVQPCSNRNYEDRNDALDLELNPNRSQPTEIREVSTTPGSAVWAKTHDQIERDNSSSSGRARSKRERKPKVHFDEVSCPLYTSRKVRRFKIMRSLGLAAPVGSPFSSS